MVLTRLSIAHYFIIMCHLWVWPANNHQWKEETKSKSAHYSLHSSKNIPFEKQIIFFRSHTFDYHKFKQSNEKPLLHFIKIHKIFQTKFSKNSFSNVFIDTCVQIILPPIFCRCTQREKKRGVHSTLLTLSFAVDQKCGVKKSMSDRCHNNKISVVTACTVHSHSLWRQRRSSCKKRSPTRTTAATATAKWCYFTVYNIAVEVRT